jgi:hypothetical protein
VRQTLAAPEANDSTFAISRAFIQAVANRAPALIRSPFADAMNSLAAVIAASVSDALEGQRVYVDDLLASDRYAQFRQRG